MSVANVICIKWGTLFGPEYVNRLYSGARRNISRPVRFLCMTEHAEGIHPDVEILPLPVEPFHEEMNAALAVANRQGAMRKISLFKPDLIPDLDGPILGFDLDVVITGDLDPLYDLAPGKVAMRHDWVEKRRGRPTGHGSVFRYDPALHGYLYDTLAANPGAEVAKARGSEQRYTSSRAKERGDFAYIPEDWVVSYKHDCMDLPPLNYFRTPRLPEGARVVCFHGRPKMPEAVEGYHGSWLRWSRPCPWLKDYWIDRAAADLGPDWA
ncbi:MAG: glycosyl transferase [Rhodobacteraceae bacterium]|nr:glycosyl transferase [Paracoccaceae bacterium]